MTVTDLDAGTRAVDTAVDLLAIALSEVMAADDEGREAAFNLVVAAVEHVTAAATSLRQQAELVTHEMDAARAETLRVMHETRRTVDELVATAAEAAAQVQGRQSAERGRGQIAAGHAAPQFSFKPRTGA
jgi:hypothetical protein